MGDVWRGGESHRQTDRQADERSRTQRNEVKLYTHNFQSEMGTVAVVAVIDETGAGVMLRVANLKVSWDDGRVRASVMCTCKPLTRGRRHGIRGRADTSYFSFSLAILTIIPSFLRLWQAVLVFPRRLEMICASRWRGTTRWRHCGARYRCRAEMCSWAS